MMTGFRVGLRVFSLALAIGATNPATAVFNGATDTSSPHNDATVSIGGCTGTLITPRVVVSAAHCFNHRDPVGDLPDTSPGNWEIPYQWTPLTDYPDGVEVRIGLDRTQPQWRTNAYWYNMPGHQDVMMFGLEEPVPSFIAVPAKPMTRVPLPWLFNPFAPRDFLIAGYGRTTLGNSGGNATRRQIGEASFGEFPSSNSVAQPNMIEVVGKSRAVARSGDSGGPLFWLDGTKRVYVGSLQQHGPDPRSRYFASFATGGTDGNGIEKPDMSDWYETVPYAPTWREEAIGLSGVEDVALCADGSLFALRNARLYQTDLNRASRRWRHRGYLGGSNISCDGSFVYYQKTGSRELWRKPVWGDEQDEWLGRPWGAAMVSGSGSLGAQVLWALNDDRSLWRNAKEGANNSWQRMGRPGAAREIFAAGNLIGAVNDDGSFWINHDDGRDQKWKRVGDTPEGTLDVTAAMVGSSEQYRVVALTESSLHIGELDGGVPAKVEAGTISTFRQPTYNGKRLDWCLEWGSNCGKPAADAFCVLSGYDESTARSMDRNIGLDSPTYVLKAGRTCASSGCDGFRRITCQKR